MEEKIENIEDKQEKCWICKRGFVEALEEFNKKVLSNKYVDDNIKSRYEKGKKEFFPLYPAGNYVEFILAEVEGPVCCGLLESLSLDIDMEDFVTRKDLEDVSIWIKE